MTRSEFEAAAKAAPDGGDGAGSHYTIVRRDSTGGLVAVPYHEAFAERVTPGCGEAP